MTHLFLAASLMMGRCEKLKADLPVFVACERADGTLSSAHIYQGAERHVRYWVRYGGMPCNEWPTVEETYIVNVVAQDLYGDKGLNATQVNEIRAAMYDGPNPPRCP